MRLLRILLAISLAGVCPADDFGLVFSTVFGGSPPRLDGLLYWKREGFHAFDASHLIQSPTGDYYVLGATASGKLPWTGGDPQLYYHCGTVMTPQICRSVFLARVRPNVGVISATGILHRFYDSTAAGLAIDPDGNAFVLEATEFMIPHTRLFKISPAGDLTTLAEWSHMFGTSLARDEVGNLLVLGQHMMIPYPSEKRGYLAVVDASGAMRKEMAALPWVPQAALISPRGAIYVAGGGVLRKYEALLSAEIARTAAPTGIRTMQFSKEGEVLAAGSDGNLGFVGAWSDSLTPSGNAKTFFACPGPMSLRPDGDVYIATSAAACPSLPATPGSFQTCRGMGGIPSDDVAVMVVKPGSGGPAYVTYLGGGEDDYAGAIMTHPDGSFTVAGSTWSQNFPQSVAAAQEKTAGGMSLFLSRIRPQAGPLVSPRCVANAASLVPGGIVAGAIHSIFGAGIVPNEVRFNGVTAEILLSSRERIDVRVPEILSGESRMELLFGGQSVTAVDIPAERADPGIFTLNQMGTGPAAATNDDGTLNSADNPARLGSVMTLYVNGIPDVNDSLRVFLYSLEPAEVIGVERQRTGILAIQARLPRLPFPGYTGVRICAAGMCSRPMDQVPMAWWQKLDPRGVSLYLAPPVFPR